jgi:acetyl-CoA carboxylase carboxyl transferase subunit alpha
LDDKAMIGGLCIRGQSSRLLDSRKDIIRKTRQYRNLEMANPEGYWKALRLMKKWAEKIWYLCSNVD